MEIQDYYRHAVTWQKQQENAALNRQEQETKRIRSEWEAIFATIHQALPVDGLRITPRDYAITEEPPRYCPIDLFVALPLAARPRQLLCASVRHNNRSWELIRWQVVDVSQEEFAYFPATSPEEAFLRVFAPDESTMQVFTDPQ